MASRTDSPARHYHRAVYPDNRYERELRRQRRLGVVLALAFLGGMYAIATHLFGRAGALLVVAPVIGAYLSVLLLKRGGGVLRFIKWLAMREVDGTRHFFGNQALCVEDHGGRCRIAARDVFAVLEETYDAQALRRVQLDQGAEAFYRDEHGEWWFTEDAVLKWVSRRAQRLDRPAQQFYLWLEREAFRPLHRKIEMRDHGGGESRAP